MDFKQLDYLVKIVENDFNLSLTAQNIHLSQPALSLSIKNLEEQEGVEIFKRERGRIIALTVAGNNLYNNALKILDMHKKMLEEFHSESATLHGTITIGVPPVVISVLFADLLLDLERNNPEIEFKIIESGAHDLKRMLILGEIDFAMLLSPSGLNKKQFREVRLYEDDLTIYMSLNNPIARYETLTWKDMDNVELGLLDESFMIHHLTEEKLKRLNVRPKKIYYSSLWDRLLAMSLNSDVVTVLPQPIYKRFTFNGIIVKKIQDPIKWSIVMAYPEKEHYNVLEIFTLNHIVDYFRTIFNL